METMPIYFLTLLLLIVPTKLHAQCINPNGVRGELLFNEVSDVFQVCTARGWFALHEPASPPPDPCAMSPSPGDVCADGTIYAGLSPDGNVPMYTTPADAGQFSWNDGTSNYVDTGMDNCSVAETTCNTGEANTALLVSLGTSPSPSPYMAARHCNDLIAHGHSDWYLPARTELNVLWANRTAIGGFDTSGSVWAGWYWSSSEFQLNWSWMVRFSDGGLGAFSKGLVPSVRCVRK